MKVSKVLGVGVSLLLAVGLLSGYSAGKTKVPDIKDPISKNIAKGPSAESLVYSWASSWSGKNFSDYSRFYSGEFSNSGHKDRASWLAFRKPRVMKEADISVEIYGLKVIEQDSRHFVAEFVQDYKSGSLAVMSLKKQRWVEEGGAWRIALEESSDVAPDHATVVAAKALPALYAAVLPAPLENPVEPNAQMQVSLPVDNRRDLAQAALASVSPAQSQNAQVSVKRFEFEGQVSALSKEVLRDSVKDFVGKNLSARDLELVAKRLTEIYQAKGYRDAIAVVTQQSFSDGIVRILVIENSGSRVSAVSDPLFPTIEESLAHIQLVTNQFLERLFPKRVVIATGY